MSEMTASAAQRRTAIVVTAPGDVGLTVAAGLRDRGWQVATVDVDPEAAVGPERIGVAFAQAVTEVGHNVALVVDCLATTTVAAQSMADLSDAAWALACEEPLRVAWFVAMAARTALQATEASPVGGMFVVFFPIGPLAGRSGQAAVGALLEGRRTLVKSAARQWGRDGVRVNALAIDLDGEATTRWPPALGRRPDLTTDVVPFLELMADERCSVLTGATLILDGGMVMAP